MKLADFEFDLPKELIAQSPSATRDGARLMILDRKSGTISHDIFRNITKYLQKNDLMVFNDTKVMPVRLVGKKESGGKIEVLLTYPLRPSLKRRRGVGGVVYEYLGKNISNAKKILFDHGLEGEIENNKIYFNVNNKDLLAYLYKYGQVPLPPYIRNQKSENRYQTVYAKVPGSAAAPTAGFHFTKRLITQIKKMGITLDYVTLHVGLGTFAPVKAEEIEQHKIHSEYFEIPKVTVDSVQGAVGRVIAVGTTTVRTLETWSTTGKTEGETDIYIYPGYKCKVIDAMITNFHMPKSSLVLLVSAFAGREFILRAYHEAIKMGYRWGSFGDAMLII